MSLRDCKGEYARCPKRGLASVTIPQNVRLMKGLTPNSGLTGNFREYIF